MAASRNDKFERRKCTSEQHKRCLRVWRDTFQRERYEGFADGIKWTYSILVQKLAAYPDTRYPETIAAEFTIFNLQYECSIIVK